MELSSCVMAVCTCTTTSMSKRLLNVYVVLRSYLLGGLGDAFRVIRQPEVRD